MNYRLLLVIALFGLQLGETSQLPAANVEDKISVTETDWPWWRGQNRNGIAASNPNVPLEWSESKNVLWKSPVVGRGHGSPTVVGEHVFLAVADEQELIQSVVCYARETGKQLWKTDLHQGGFKSKGRQGNFKSTKASSTIACDGKRLFINFLNADAVHLSALSLSGDLIWQKKVTDYVTHQGYGSSPTVYGPLVIASADNKGGGAISAFNRLTGELVWTNKRPKIPNYTSPIILKIDGKDQLLFTGCNLVTSYDPLTGKLNWEHEGATEECVSSTVTDGTHIVTSGGYPKNHTTVVRADGSGEVMWTRKTKVYVPSMLLQNGYLYAITDSGIAICYVFKTGEIKWKGRLNAKFSSSPVLIGDNIFVTSEDGRTFVLKASPSSLEVIAENKLADEVYATPTICGNRIYMRVAFGQNKERYEMLYCLEKQR